MDFFDINFSNIFLEKHGKEAFDDIVKQINREKKSICDIDDIEVIFKVAFLEFLDMDRLGIEHFLKDTMPEKKEDVKDIKSLHKKSIRKIKKYIKDIMKEK